MIDTLLFAGFALAYVGLLLWGTLAPGVGPPRLATPAALPLLVVAGLVYDNTVLALGRAVGEGPVLEGLSAGRYWIHALVTPLLVVFAWHAVARTGVAWARTRAAAVVAWCLAGALVVLEVVTVAGHLELEAQREHGVLSYADAGSGGPPVMVAVVGLVLVATGAVLLRRRRWPWLLVGAGLMVVGGAVPLPVESGAVTNAFELALLVAVVATRVHQDRAARTSSTAPRVDRS